MPGIETVAPSARYADIVPTQPSASAGERRNNARTDGNDRVSDRKSVRSDPGCGVEEPRGEHDRDDGRFAEAWRHVDQEVFDPQRRHGLEVVARRNTRKFLANSGLILGNKPPGFFTFRRHQADDTAEETCSASRSAYRASMTSTTRACNEGIAQILEAWKGWATAIPDSKATFVAEYASGDTAILEVIWRGVHTGPLQMPTRRVRHF
jgi:hypothetical protein